MFALVTNTASTGCRQLFIRLTDISLRPDLAIALAQPTGTFRFLLNGMMDWMNIPVPANHNNNNGNEVIDRLYSMTVLQSGSFDNFYDNNGSFREVIGLLLTHALATGADKFVGQVTPGNTPERKGGGNDGGGNKGGGNKGGGNDGGGGGGGNDSAPGILLE